MIRNTDHLFFGKALPLLAIAMIAGCQSKDAADTQPDAAQQQIQETLVAQKPAVLFSHVEVSSLSRVDRAYRVIQKQRSLFDPTNASVKPSHREYLMESLALIDQAVLWRVSGMQAIAKGENNAEKWVRGADNLLASLRSLRAPKELERHQYLLQESVLAYQSFFRRWNGQPVMISRQLVEGDTDLRKATHFARGAYDHLMTVNQRANPKAQADFYYAHMALDPS